MQALETERLILKSPDESFADLLSEFYLANYDFLKKSVPLSEPASYFPEEIINKLKKEKDLSEKGVQMSLYVFRKDQMNKITGNVSLLNITADINGSGNLAYMIDENETGNGFASEAAEKIIEFAFNEMNLSRLDAFVMLNNIPSVKLLEKLNFSKIKTLKNFMNIDGKPEDHFQYRLINLKSSRK